MNSNELKFNNYLTFFVDVMLQEFWVSAQLTLPGLTFCSEIIFGWKYPEAQRLHTSGRKLQNINFAYINVININTMLITVINSLTCCSEETLHLKYVGSMNNFQIHYTGHDNWKLSEIVNDRKKIVKYVVSFATGCKISACVECRARDNLHLILYIYIIW